MGDIDSVTGVHLVQLEKRQIQIGGLFYLFLLLGDMAKNLTFCLKYFTNSRFCTILTSQLENVATA